MVKSECPASSRSRVMSSGTTSNKPTFNRQLLKEKNKRLNAFIHIFKEPRASGSGPLHGLTYAAKDNFCTQGIPTTAGSKILEGWTPPYESTVTQRLHDAGAALVGKTNMDEFAMGTSTENSAFGTVHNPWDLDKVPGVSSGGSAATVAAGLVDFAIGTDTGGSSRQPAALCGVYGFKPTYGRISRYGIIPLGSSLDQAGIFSRDVATISKVLGVVAGLDPLDATSSAKPLELTSGDTKGLKVGLLRDDLAQEGLQSEVGEATLQAAEALRRQGAEIIEVALPALKFSIATYYVILPAEASSNLARYDGIHFNHASGRGKTLLDRYVETRSDLFGDEPKRRILIGTFSLSAGYQEAYYKKAQ